MGKRRMKHMFYKKEDITMNEQKVKTMLNREVIKQIKDYSMQQVLTSILFSPSNSIDWDQAYTFIMTFMPELNQYDGYKVENMK